MGQIDNTAMSPDLSELPMLVGKLRLVGESDEATKAAGTLASMAMDADNRVAISKVDGVLRSERKFEMTTASPSWMVPTGAPSASTTTKGPMF